MKKAPVSVARRYARALLDLALEKETAATVDNELRAVAGQLSSQDDLRQALAHPAVSVEKKKKIAAAVWKSSDPLVFRLLNLLIERGRLPIVADVHEAFILLWNEQRGIVAAEAVSAAALTAAQTEKLTASAKQLAGSEVTLTTTVDPALIGGVVVRMNGRTYDGSLKAQLRALRARLASGTGVSSS